MDEDLEHQDNQIDSDVQINEQESYNEDDNFINNKNEKNNSDNFIDNEYEKKDIINDEEDDDEEGDDEVEYEKIKCEINNLKTTTYLNPYDYNNHIKLIEFLKTAGEFDELKEARNHMSSIYPLSPNLWLDWIKDEIKFNDIKEVKDYIFNLFERAIKDYLSLDVWIEYLEFALIFSKEKDCLDNIKKIFDNALVQLGLHPKGDKIWELNRLLIQNFDTYDDKNKILKKFELYKRNFSVPFLKIENVYEEFNNWFSKVKENNVDLKFDEDILIKSYNKSKNETIKLKPFEDELDKNSDLFTYYKYIDFEIENKCPNRIQLIFERSITDHCLETELWLKYIVYLNENVPFFDKINCILKRAVQNVSWSSKIWIEYLNVMERFNKPENEVQEIFEKSLSAGFVDAEDYKLIWLTYLEYKRRKTDFNCDKQKEKLLKIFQTAIEHLATIPGSDENFSINIFLAIIEAKYCLNIKKAREIWDNLLSFKNGISNDASFWLKYALLERLYGDNEHYKKVLLKSLNYCFNEFDLIKDQLLNYCREECINIKEVDDIKQAINKIYKKIQSQKIVTSKNQIQNKRKNETFKDENLTKKTKLKQDNKPKIDRTEIHHNQNELFKIPKDVSFKTTSKPIDKSQALNKKSENDTNALQTVIVKNLDFNLTEHELKNIFSQFGKIQDIRLVKNYKGKSKGFCYIEYSSIEEVKTALKNDRFLINNRPAFICEMNLQHEFKFKNELEKNKLFVSNIPLNLKQEDLKKIFEEFGNLKEIRLATYRNGHSKGIAYIDFKDDQTASRALLKTDGLEIEGKKINVHISNPPKKKSNSSTFEDVPILGSGFKKKASSSGHGKQRINL